MWKKVCCAAPVSLSCQVEDLRSVKAAFLREQSGRAAGAKCVWVEGSGSRDAGGEKGPCAVGAISRPSNCG